MSGYTKYLRSEHWQKTRKKVKRLGDECYICGSKENLDTHHKTYKRLGHENVKTDLYILCRRHHHEIHQFAKENGLHIWAATEVYRKSYIKKHGFRWGKRDISDYWSGTLKLPRWLK